MKVRTIVVMLLGLWVLSSVSGSPVKAQSPCDDPNNLIYNCDFDTFTTTPVGLVPEGWWPFVVSGSPAFDNMCDSPKCPALRIWSDGLPFIAGIYQQVPNVQPGVAYRARIGWAVFTSLSPGPHVERKIGIDPYGGTDPTSPNVVWSPSVWEPRRVAPELQVSAVAQNTVITVFVWVNNASPRGRDQVFLDAVGLVVDPNQPPPPTFTPVPTPTFTPLPPPTSTPTFTPSPTPSPSPSPTATPTPTPTATPTPSPSYTPTSTPTATSTPSPTSTPTATCTPTSTPTLLGRLTSNPPGLAFLLLLTIAGILTVTAGVLLIASR